MFFVLNYEQGIAAVAQIIHHSNKPADVARMQADTRLVHYEQRVHERSAETGREIDALHFAAAQRSGRTIQRQVTNADLAEIIQTPANLTPQHLRGPVVRNEIFFFVLVFGAAVLLIFREWLTASHAKIAQAATDAEKRLLSAQQRRQRNWMLAGASACLAVILVLTADFIYARANSAPPSAHALAASGPGKDELRVPLSEVQDGNLHLFTVHVPDATSGDQSFRFLVIKKPQGWGVALDACRICGAEGYRQDGQNVVCRHCASAIYIPSIGDQGGCNPIGVPAHGDGGDIVIDISDLAQKSKEIPQ